MSASKLPPEHHSDHELDSLADIVPAKSLHNEAKERPVAKGENGQVERLAAELIRARARQRTRYMMMTLGLLVVGVLSAAAIAFSNATVVRINPAAARQHAVVTVVEGFGAMLGNALYTLSGHAVIEATSPGFRPLRQTVQASDFGTTFKLNMTPLPGHLHITTHPSAHNTRWFIDGRMVVVADLLNQDVAAGKHSITINSPYYQQTRMTVSPERGKTVRQTVALKPVAGHLNIRTIPSGASIRINGDGVGSSPLNMAKAGGRYRIEVSLDDYRPVTETIDITHANHNIDRQYRLALRDGYLHVQTKPAGGRLLLDGRLLDNKLLDKKRLDGKQIMAGKGMEKIQAVPLSARVAHTLIYAKRGYVSQHRRITVAVGEKRNIAFHLKPDLGKLRIVSRPVAMVNVDGRDIGKTPLSTTLSTLPHRIIIHQQGYRSYRRTITPNSRSAQRIRVRLQSERAAKLAESPLIMTNAAGIEMKQFRPHGVFVMGAPRSETGQRANEFLRRVKLTKAFYISTHEVSRAQFSRFKHVAGAGNEPVTSVSWAEAALYCNWLSRQAHLTQFYTVQGGRVLGFDAKSDGYRLPSEAEWEWLARKAFKTKESRFTWGDETTIPPQSGNIADEDAKGSVTHYVPNYSDGFAGVAPVGSYPPDKTGLFDLTGNVSEWVHDVYSLVPPLGQVTETDPMGARRGDTHTVKGSNWRSGTISELMAAYREGEKAGRDDIGFRVARYVFM